MTGSAASQSPLTDTAAHAAASSKLRQRNRILSAQNDSSHPQIDEILAQKENGSDTHRNGTTSQGMADVKPQVKGVSTSRPTSPLMPIVRSLEKLGEKVPSLPKMPGMPEIKLPASSIEVKRVVFPFSQGDDGVLMPSTISQLCTASNTSAKKDSNSYGSYLVVDASYMLYYVPLTLVSNSLLLKTVNSSYCSDPCTLCHLHLPNSSMPIFWPLIGPYLVWIFWFDKAPGRGGRTSMWFRRWKVWKHFAGQCIFLEYEPRAF